MGMYTTLCDEQVKCFPSPCYPLSRNSKELNDVELSFYSSGGALKYYGIGDTVPFVTPFYNYGKNFIIFDYRDWSFDDRQNQAIFIIDGKLDKILLFFEITEEDLEGIDLVVDNYGCPLNITKPEHFIEIVNEYKNGMSAFNFIAKERLQENGIENVMTMEFREKVINHEVTPEQMRVLFEANEKIKEEVFNEYVEPLNIKWRANENLETVKKIHGFYEIGFIIHTFSTLHLLEWEKYKVVELYLQYLNEQNKTLKDELSAYFKWCDEGENFIDKEQVKKWFKKYGKPAPQHTINNFLKSATYKNQCMFL